jgi:hypothetical protein
MLFAMEAKPQFSSLFGEEFTAWTIRKTDLSGARTDSLALAGDTIVDGMRYYKINSYLGPTFPSQCVRCLAEDTVHGKVWFFNAEYPEPALIMDLSLEVGDQFEVLSQFGGMFEVIATYTDPQGRYTVEFDSPIDGLSVPENFKFIEGYGPNRGIDYADGNCPSPDPYALCHYKDGLLVGHASDPVLALVCEVPTRIMPLEDTSLVKVWPNPGIDMLHIEIDVTDKLDLRVLDATGRAILTGTSPDGTLEFSTLGLAPAIYLVEVNTSAGRRTVKWMKQ